MERLIAGLMAALTIGVAGVAAQGQEMIFTSSGDVGKVGAAGRLEFDRQTGNYRITASGANIWDRVDGFYFARREVRGDVTMAATIEWGTKGGHEHKKAGLMLRAGPGPSDPHASAMVHADGLVSLQYRAERGGPTLEVRSPVKAPVARVLLARHGNVISMEVARPGGTLEPAAAVTVVLPERLQAGLAACSHNDADSQTAVFGAVIVDEQGPVADKTRVVESTLETVDITTGERHLVYRATRHFEAPNWSPDGKYLYFNGTGNIYRFPVSGGSPELIDTGEVRVNNDHGLSADGKTLAISGSVARSESRIYLAPSTGGTPRLVTPQMPSYWHGWSPDGKTLAYCASRNDEFDVYTIPVEGGEEKRLTTAKGLDDGPDYSPDGQFIYFNSERSGLMRVWRMKADGRDQQMFSRSPDSADWFPHPSPDGKWIVYLSYHPSVKGHPPNKDVTIRIVPSEGGEPRTLVTLFGGQGSLNVPSWSPDSTRFAFVSYRLVKKPAE